MLQPCSPTTARRRQGRCPVPRCTPALFEHVRHRAAHEPESDTLRPVEGDQLHRRDTEPPAEHRREMLYERYISPALHDSELRSHRPRSPAKIGPGDHIEDDPRSRSDLDGERAERAQAPTPAGVDSHLARDRQVIAGAYEAASSHQRYDICSPHARLAYGPLANTASRDTTIDGTWRSARLLRR